LNVDHAQLRRMRMPWNIIVSPVVKTSGIVV
jgi:hypothetical protein